jgi:hypothetical protein
VGDLPPEAGALLSVTPGDFVAERKRLARTLRDDGRGADAEAVSALRKPTAVVLAVNRAVRELPDVARDAVAAVDRVRRTQVAGVPDEYQSALGELERALADLAVVANRELAGEGAPSETMRRRVNELLRAAATDTAANEAFVAGALTHELDPAGFSPFEGVRLPPRAARSRAGEQPRPRERRSDRISKLKKQLAESRATLRAAERDLSAATRRRDRAARAVRTAEAALARQETE